MIEKYIATMDPFRHILIVKFLSSCLLKIPKYIEVTPDRPMTSVTSDKPQIEVSPDKPMTSVTSDKAKIEVTPDRPMTSAQHC